MPSSYDHVDVRVLEEVERVLTSTSFASIHDLVDRLDVGSPAVAPVRTVPRHRPNAVLEPAIASGEPVAPLPRRR